jgi:hypothetical protein
MTDRLLTLCLATPVLCGCAAHKSERTAVHAPAPNRDVAIAEAAPAAPPPAAPLDQQSIGWNTAALAVRSDPVAVKEGAVPLFYLVETPGSFRVHDLTEGRDLARVNAAGRSIVRVDGRTGVVIGGETLVPGPLNKDHRYVIYRDPTGPNMARQGTFQVPPPPRANPQAAQDHGGQDSQGGPNVER